MCHVQPVQLWRGCIIRFLHVPLRAKYFTIARCTWKKEALVKFWAISNYWNVIWKLAANQWAVMCPPSTRALIYFFHTFWNLFRPGHTTRIGGQIESASAKNNVLQCSMPWYVHAHNLGYWKKCFTHTPELRRNLVATHWKKDGTTEIPCRNPHLMAKPFVMVL